MAKDVKDTPLVTVLMPVFNAEMYVKQAIESILHQTYTHFELLVINDGSTDASVEMIKSFTDDRIHLIENQSNLGLIATLNKGFELAKGKYIARMDADDISLKDRLKEQVRYMEAHPEVGVFGCAYAELKHHEVGKETIFLSNHDSLKSVLFFNSCMAHPTVMLRTEVIRQNELSYNSEFKHAEDYEYWVRSIELTKFSNTPKVLLHYRIHDKQVSTKEIAAQKIVGAHIRLVMIESLGIRPSELEMFLHNAIGNKETLKGYENLKFTEQWFLKLIEANNTAHRVNSQEFNYYLAMVFQDVCANASVGLRAYRLFKRSALAAYAKHGFMFKFKFLIKCLFR